MTGKRSGAYRNEKTNDKKVSNHREQEDPKHITLHNNQNSKKNNSTYWVKRQQKTQPKHTKRAQNQDIMFPSQ